MWIIFLVTTLIASSTAAYLFLSNKVAQKPLKSFSKYYEKTEVMPELELVRIDKFGNKWFTFKNILQIHTKRATDSEFAARWAEYGMTQEMFVKKMTQAKAVITKDPILSGNIIQDLLDRATLAAEEETLKLLAAQLYLLEGENPIQLTSEFLEKKMKIWNEDEDTKGFFLHLAYTTLRDLKQLSEGDLLTYLKEQEVQRVMRKMRPSVNRSLGSVTKSTHPLSQHPTNQRQKKS